MMYDKVREDIEKAIISLSAAIRRDKRETDLEGDFTDVQREAFFNMYTNVTTEALKEILIFVIEDLRSLRAEKNTLYNKVLDLEHKLYKERNK